LQSVIDAASQQRSPDVKQLLPGALGALLVIAAIGAAEASAIPGQFYTVSGDTGPLSFSIPTHNGFSSDTVLLGEDRVSINNVAFNPALGSIVGAVAQLAFAGDTFKVVYQVEGFGNEVVFSDTVSAKISALLNGVPFGTPETFNVNLSGSCGGPNGPDVDNLCSAKSLLNAFAGSDSIVLPPGSNASDVTFVYSVLQSNEHCVVNDYTGGILSETSACLDGGTSIYDTSNLFDPSWNAQVTMRYEYVPEPASLAVLGFGVACAISARRRRRWPGVSMDIR
jgi:PEP-CTERM motif